MNEIFAGRYELVDPIASGGAGTVWRVWDHRESAFRAGKVLKQSDSASLMRFVRETRSRIHHPHVVAPLGWVGEDDRVMFTMPLVRGGSLSTLIKDYGALPEAWAVAASVQLLDALAAIHDAGLVHRDVKTGNVLLVPGTTPDVQLIDFGIAAPIGDPRLTRDTQVIGTPGYMSPEAVVGADPEPSQDLYSAGVVLWEMLTGARPPREGAPAIPDAAASTPLGGVVTRLLAGPDARFPSAAAARDALRALDVPASPGDPIVVFDQIPPVPDGWRPAANPWQAASSPRTPWTVPQPRRDPAATPGVSSVPPAHLAAAPPAASGERSGATSQAAAEPLMPITPLLPATPTTIPGEAGVRTTPPAVAPVSAGPGSTSVGSTTAAVVPDAGATPSSATAEAHPALVPAAPAASPVPVAVTSPARSSSALGSKLPLVMVGAGLLLIVIAALVALL